MFANGFRKCTDTAGHKYSTVGDGVQQCDNCKQKQYYDYVTKEWRPTK